MFLPYRTAILAAAVVGMLGTAELRGADEPDRLMFFLSPDAEVREQGPMVAIAGEDVDVQLVKSAPPGDVRERFDQVQLNLAGTAMRQFLTKITGADPGSPIQSSAVNDNSAPGVRIYLGAPDGDPEALFPELAEADGHGFVVASKANDRGSVDLYLVGKTPVATQYAAWFFLQNYAGLRLVMPGEIGEIYETRDRLEIPRDLYVFNPGPDYKLRVWSGHGGMTQAAWLADFGGSSRFEYHHNMYRIYPPDRFGDSHAEFYPVVNGERVIPEPGEKSAWQPTYSEPATVERAIEYADEQFTENPRLMAISLSVNDGGGYSEIDLRQGQVNEQGKVSISEIYYDYVNQVARAIKEKWPDKYVTFYPYGSAEDPPSFELEDNVLMILFHEPKEQYAEWSHTNVQQFGVYQWLYGATYVAPNHWPHAMQEYLQYVHSVDGFLFKGEAYPAWAQDGAKLWVMSNLLWNVNADVDALLEDYYEHAFGSAAPAARRYFEKAEALYERRREMEQHSEPIWDDFARIVGEREIEPEHEVYRMAQWKPGLRQFRGVTQEDYDALATAIDEARSLARQGDEDVQRRVEMLAVAFEWGERYWDQVAALRRMADADVSSEAEVEQLLETIASYPTIAEDREVFEEEKLEPFAVYSVYSNTTDQVDWSAADPRFTFNTSETAAYENAFQAISEYKLQNQSPEQVDQFWQRIAEERPDLASGAGYERLRLLHGEDAKLTNYFDDGSFEQGPDEEPPALTSNGRAYYNRVASAETRRTNDTAKDGQWSLQAQGIGTYVGILGRTSHPAGRTRLSFWYKTTPQTGAIVVVDGGKVGRWHLPPSEEWTRYEVDYLPTAAKPFQRVNYGMVIAMKDGATEDSTVWFDDVRVELLAPEGLESASDD